MSAVSAHTSTTPLTRDARNLLDRADKVIERFGTCSIKLNKLDLQVIALSADKIGLTGRAHTGERLFSVVLSDRHGISYEDDPQGAKFHKMIGEGDKAFQKLSKPLDIAYETGRSVTPLSNLIETSGTEHSLPKLPTKTTPSQKPLSLDQEARSACDTLNKILSATPEVPGGLARRVNDGSGYRDAWVKISRRDDLESFHITYCPSDGLPFSRYAEHSPDQDIFVSPNTIRYHPYGPSPHPDPAESVRALHRFIRFFETSNDPAIRA